MFVRMLNTGKLIPSAIKPPSSVLHSSLHNLPGLHLPPTTELLPSLGVHTDLAPAPAVGGECDPDNLPNDIPSGMVCQLMMETRMVVAQGRFRNAFGGDAILTPGGVSLISKILTYVDVPQLYSHSGIMTSNFEQITHCTASEDRQRKYPVGSIVRAGPQPTRGFRPDVIKYGWPGAMT